MESNDQEHHTPAKAACLAQPARWRSGWRRAPPADHTQLTGHLQAQNQEQSIGMFRAITDFILGNLNPGDQNADHREKGLVCESFDVKWRGIPDLPRQASPATTLGSPVLVPWGSPFSFMEK